MRRMLTLMVIGVVGALSLQAPAFAAGTESAGVGQHPVAFVMVTPNTAIAPQSGTMAMAGDWIQVTGGGRLDPVAGAVQAGGWFRHYRADGTVHCQGTWSATTLLGWTQVGRHGGSIALLVTHVCGATGEVHTGIPMTVTARPDAPGSADRFGVTVGEFTVPTGGVVLIHTGTP